MLQKLFLSLKWTFLTKHLLPKKHIFLLLLLFICYPQMSRGQSSEKFKDEQLEKLLKENATKVAKDYLTEKLKNQNQMGLDEQVYFLNRYSQLHLVEGDFAEALVQAKKSETILQRNPESPLWGETFRAVCFAYIRKGNLDSALIYAEKLYDFTKKTNDIILRRSALVAMGNISLQNKSYQKSLDFYLEALQITEKEGEKLNLKVDYYNVGLAYAQLKLFQKSKNYLLKAASLAEKENALDLLARAYGTLADINTGLSDFDAQESFLKKANEIAEKIGNKQLLAMGYANLSESALRKGNYEMAIDLGKKSLDQLKDRPILQIQAKVDSMLYVSYKKTGNIDAALSQLENYDAKKLILRNQAEKEKLDKLTLEFEVEKKDLLIEKQLVRLKEEGTKNKLFLIGIITLAIITFLLGYINFKNSRTRKLLFKKERELDQIVRLNTFISKETLEENLTKEPNRSEFD